MFEEVRSRLTSCKRPRVLTGAGVSAESGVPTFRGPGGLWKDFKPEDLATPEAFYRDPKLVWEWYDWRRTQLAKLRPNAAHEALSSLEKIHEDFWLITQNVDGLHKDAGSKKILHLHGDIWRLRCTSCGKHFEDRRAPLPVLPPACPECSGMLRPGVVWFGETLPAGTFAKAREAAREADLFLVIGTAGTVEPAASLAKIARSGGAFVVEINLEDTALTPYCQASLRGKAAEILPGLLR